MTEKTGTNKLMQNTLQPYLYAYIVSISSVYIKQQMSLSYNKVVYSITMTNNKNLSNF